MIDHCECECEIVFCVQLCEPSDRAPVAKQIFATLIAYMCEEHIEYALDLGRLSQLIQC